MRGVVGGAIAAPSKVSAHFRAAFAYLMPFTGTHLTVRLVVSALFVPLIGLLLGTVVGFSGRSAVTDQDIARLLLTPAGACAVLAAISLGIAAAVLDVAVMMHTLASRELRVIPAIRRGCCLRRSAFSAHTALQFRAFPARGRHRVAVRSGDVSNSVLVPARPRHQLLLNLPSAGGPACCRHHRRLCNGHGLDPPVTVDRLGRGAATRPGPRHATGCCVQRECRAAAREEDDPVLAGRGLARIPRPYGRWHRDVVRRHDRLGTVTSG